MPIPVVNPTGADSGVCAYGVAGSFQFGSADNSTERAPDYRQVDMSLFKDFHVWEQQVVGFRADFFNAFNIVSYGNPDNSISDFSTNPLNNNWGRIGSVRSPERQIQLSLHYIF